MWVVPYKPNWQSVALNGKGCVDFYHPGYFTQYAVMLMLLFVAFSYQHTTSLYDQKVSPSKRVPPTRKVYMMLWLEMNSSFSQISAHPLPLLLLALLSFC